MAGRPARYTAKEHHDLVVENLSANVEEVFNSGFADNFRVYSDNQKLYDSRLNFNYNPRQIIQSELLKTALDVEPQIDFAPIFLQNTSINSENFSHFKLQRLNMSDYYQIFSDKAARQLWSAEKELRETQNFTYEGLLELHAKTFRDDYNHSTEVSDYFADYDRVRESDPDGFWSKNRPIDEYGKSLSIYSSMSKEDIERTSKAIQNASPEIMKDLSFYEKTERLAAMYKEIDYTHSFAEGNSRVTRVFVGEMARASGIQINWNKIDRNDLYIARDKALAESAIKYRGNDLKMAVDSNGHSAYDLIKTNHAKLTERYPKVTLSNEIRNVSSDLNVLRQQQAQTQTESIKSRQRLK